MFPVGFHMLGLLHHLGFVHESPFEYIQEVHVEELHQDLLYEGVLELIGDALVSF